MKYITARVRPRVEKPLPPNSPGTDPVIRWTPFRFLELPQELQIHILSFCVPWQWSVRITADKSSWYNFPVASMHVNRDFRVAALAAMTRARHHTCRFRMQFKYCISLQWMNKLRFCQEYVRKVQWAFLAQGAIDFEQLKAVFPSLSTVQLDCRYTDSLPAWKVFSGANAVQVLQGDYDKSLGELMMRSLRSVVVGMDIGDQVLLRVKVPTAWLLPERHYRWPATTMVFDLCAKKDECVVVRKWFCQFYGSRSDVGSNYHDWARVRCKLPYCESIDYRSRRGADFHCEDWLEERLPGRSSELTIRERSSVILPPVIKLPVPASDLVWQSNHLDLLDSDNLGLQYS